MLEILETANTDNKTKVKVQLNALYSLHPVS